MTIIIRRARNARTRIFGAAKSESDGRCPVHGYYPGHFGKCPKCP